MLAMYEYNGFKVTVREDKSPPVAVFDLRYPRDPALYRDTSLDLAMRWIDAYRKGEHWAVSAAVRKIAE